MDASLRRRFEETLGSDFVLEQGSLLCPATAKATSVALRIAAEGGLRLRVSSGRTTAGTTPDGGSVLSLQRMRGIAIDAAAGIARVEAGATLDQLRSALAAAAVGVAGLAASGQSGHLGAVIARGELPRRSICGVEAVLPGGDLVRGGGAMLKDVVGYDLAAVLLGSSGRLAAITSVHLRLAPLHARVPSGPPPGPHPGSDLARAFDPAGLLLGS